MNGRQDCLLHPGLCPSSIPAFLLPLLCLASVAVRAVESPGAAHLRFEVTIQKGLIAAPQAGRLFVILSTTNDPEPRLMLGQAGADAPTALARDLNNFAPGAVAVLDKRAFISPGCSLSQLRHGDYFVQALFDFNKDLRSPNAPGNLFSLPQKLHLNPSRSARFPLELGRQIPPEPLPSETEYVKFIKLQSNLLSQFHGRPIFLRAGLVLPRDYQRDPSRRYPLWINIGGLNARYTRAIKLMAEDSEFRKTWLAGDTPGFILLQLDGAGPYGDPYQINSANNGPYGDALIQELIPNIEANFRALGHPRARVLSGISTGGWVALALQTLYPDFFNGAWAACPDPVDFRALELVNIYEDDNAFVNKHGCERPSARDLDGDVTLTMRREVQMENLLGRLNSYTLSGQQWGAWNAAFGPRGANGLPVPLWEPDTGKINHTVARQWEKYDLRLVLERNWQTLGPKLRGKLHITAGEADNYFLNNAVHLLDSFLSGANPPFDGKIVYGPREGHGWTNLSLREMMEEMKTATGRSGD